MKEIHVSVVGDINPVNIELLRSAGLLEGVSHLEVSPIKGGMTNDSYLIKLDGESKYVYRHPGLGTSETMDRVTEDLVYSKVGHLGITDEVLYIDPVSGIKVTTYVEGARDLDTSIKEEVDTAVSLLVGLHHSGLTIDKTLDYGSEVDKFRSSAIESGMIEPPTMRNLVDRVVSECTSYLSEFSDEFVLCHVDPASVNFLMGSDGQVRLIDWEYSAMSHPMLDLAMYTMYEGHEADESEEILLTYFEKVHTNVNDIEDAIERSLPMFHASKALAGIMWYYWTVHREVEGEMYGEYGGDQLRMSLSSYDKFLKYIKEDN